MTRSAALEQDARMEKSPDAFRTISEVAEELDVPAHVLRFWESKFPQVKPMKRGGGRRYYRPQDVALLSGIRNLLYTDGLTIKGVQKIFREQGARRVTARGAEEGAETTAAPAAVLEPETVAIDPASFAAPAAEAATPSATGDKRARMEAALRKLIEVRDELRSA